MKTNEFMAGDLIEVISNDHLKYVRIKEIYQSSILTEESEYESEEIGIDNIKPIPIIPEILEKFGFKYNPFSTGFYECKTEDGNIACTMSNWWSFYVNDNIIPNHFHYAHELQHVFKLCGITLNIEV